MNQAINKSEVKRSWWYSALRAIGHFCYRNWLLILLLFVISIVASVLYMYNLRKKEINCCIQYDRAQKQLKKLETLLINCQFCIITNPIDTAAINNTKVMACDFQNDNSGGKGHIFTKHNLGNNPGTVTITYDMVNIADEMDVYYDGQLVASTNGLVRGRGKLSFVYTPQNSKPDFCTIEMTAPKNGTVWTYYIGCPK